MIARHSIWAGNWQISKSRFVAKALRKISLHTGAGMRTLTHMFYQLKAPTNRSTGRVNITQSFRISMRRLRNGTSCRKYPTTSATKRCSPGRCRVRSSNCSQASVNSLENGHPDQFRSFPTMAFSDSSKSRRSTGTSWNLPTVPQVEYRNFTFDLQRRSR